jgi:16S rRNA (adenine1518-N6/adenine1519-N6)-dimethyltransferase
LRQRYGQHFLSDHAVAQRIVEAAAIESNDTVLEIGPGKGVLTDMLASRAGKLIAVEIDTELAEKLRTRFCANPKIEIITANFLDLGLETITTPVKIVSNLPYYVSTAIIERFLPWQGWSNAVVMVQKEVGLRICAQTNDSDYGYYSLLCQYYAAAKPLFGVAPSSFSPPPDVDSLVINLSNKNSLAPPAGVFDLIKQAFAHRRKNVLNAFTISTTRDKAAFKHLLEKAAISPLARPQNLAWKDYQALQELLTTL